MKRIYKVVLLNVSFLATVVSFQNCAKVHPELLIDDKMAANGSANPEVSTAPAINTNDVPAGAQVVVDQPPTTPMDPAPSPIQVVVDNPTNGDECPNKGPGGDRKHGDIRDHDRRSHAEHISKSEDEDHSELEENDDHMANSDQDFEQDVADNKKHRNKNELEGSEQEQEKDHDSEVCESGKSGDHKVVVLDDDNKVFDGSLKNENGKPTYIFSEASDIEIRNTRGKTIVCNCKVKKIENNVGKLVLVNSIVDELDKKRGNLVVVDSTASKITNMKGVIRK